MSQLAGKGAVVTGGSRGIGRAIVERLAADGATVVFSYATNAAGAEEAIAAAKAAGGEAHAVAADFTDPGAALRLMESAAGILDGLDILVNNAAPRFDPIPLAQFSETDFDRHLATGAQAPFLTMRYAAGHMRDNGRIISISTLNTMRAAPGTAGYVAAKGALEQLTQVAAAELGVRGVTANVVSPGATDTELLRTTNPADALELVATMTPLRRLGAPEDVADVVSFLAGPDSRWITGQNLRATGGLV